MITTLLLFTLCLCLPAHGMTEPPPLRLSDSTSLTNDYSLYNALATKRTLLKQQPLSPIDLEAISIIVATKILAHNAPTIRDCGTARLQPTINHLLKNQHPTTRSIIEHVIHELALIAYLACIQSPQTIDDLDLSMYRCQTMPNLHPFSNLKTLSIMNCPLNSLQGLSDLEHLEELWLSNNALTSLWGLGNLKNLKQLDLCGNQLTSSAGLSKLTKLTYLNLSSNRLPCLRGLNSLRKLIFLNVCSNFLTTLPSLNKLNSLEEIHARSNRIATLPVALYTLPRLRLLDLSNNSLTVEQLHDVDKIPSLAWLAIGGNPLTALPNLTAVINFMLLYLHDDQRHLVNNASMPPTVKIMYT